MAAAPKTVSEHDDEEQPKTELAAALEATMPREKLYKQNPEESANCFSRLIFWFVGPLMDAGQTRTLYDEDMFPLREDDKTEKVVSDFYALYEEELARGNEKPVQGAIFRQFGMMLAKGAALKFINSTVQFAPMIFMFFLLRAIEKYAEGAADAPPVWEGYVWTLALFVAMSTKTIIENAYFHIVFAMGFRLRTAVVAFLFRKSLRLSPTAKQSTRAGDITALMSIDSLRLDQFCFMVANLWDGIYQICGLIGLLYYFLGPSAFAGLGATLLLAPAMIFFQQRLSAARQQIAKRTDKRTSLVNEILQGIKAIKLYNWEEPFIKIVSDIRNDELVYVRKMANESAKSSTVMFVGPTLVAIVTLIVFAASAVAPFKPSSVFAAMSVLGQLRFALLFFPLALAGLANAQVSMRRIERFMSGIEVQKEGVDVLEDESLAIRIKNGVFYWQDPAAPVEPLLESTPDKSKTKAKDGEEEVDEEERKRREKEEAAARAAQEAARRESLRTPVLVDLDVEIKKGELIAVVGPVGVGKSALCAAILGELHRTEESSLAVRGRIAYAAQTAWIVNATVRENIIFGHDIDERRYRKVLRACQLKVDLENLPDGDQTEIGEKGVTLSGGQKQRVSLARAMYANADVYIFDDPLSALDPEVGARVFGECIHDALSDKTRILVTHAIHVLRDCDRVLVIDRSEEGLGTIALQGTYDELLSNPEFAAKMDEYAKTAEEEEEEGGDGEAGEEFAGGGEGEGVGSGAEGELGRRRSSSTGEVRRRRSSSGTAGRPSTSVATKPAAKLMADERREVGNVQLRYYMQYLQSGDNWQILLFGIVALSVITQFNGLTTQWWVSFWTNDYKYVNFPIGFYMGIYAMLGIMAGVLNYARLVTILQAGVNASRSLHHTMFQSVIQAPMAFFDTTPLGRLVTRFSNDIDQVDTMLPNQFGMLGLMFFLLVGSMVAIIFVTPWFAVAVLPIIIIYRYILIYYLRVSREVKRTEATSKSPVFVHYSETLTGLSTIRAYGASDRFAKENADRNDRNISAYYTLKTCERWLSVRLEFLGNAVFLLAACLAVFTASNTPREGIAGLAGMSLTFAMGITGIANWLVRTSSEVEQMMSYVERIVDLIENTPDEPLKALPADRTLPPNWPTKGDIVFRDLKMRYRDDTETILKGVNVEIPGGTRVGIVGRTGSGKSSLMVALFRLVVDRCVDGSIIIDGIDTQSISLSALRSRLSIIPQEAILFSGTIRSNLDPVGVIGTGAEADEKLWDVLRKVGLEATVQHVGGLDAKVAEFGENFSQGQRQLLCFCRVLLRETSILLLDEATSSIDHETDKAIQLLLRKEFPTQTILTIAHRLETIIDYDRVLVMDDGVVREFGEPHELLQNPDSVFSSIVAETGDVAPRLRDAASRAHDVRASGASAAEIITAVADVVLESGEEDDQSGGIGAGASSASA